jgi:alkanesulfonate monooxygenase SsuD/methylene tetrahydromethanopterin reductase-like flavin-dependent oxidoreductase (luciferase family)
MPRVGVLFPTRWPDERLPAFARAAERGGFDELWLAEDCFAAGGLALAATALALTETLSVGIGLLPAAVRNPAIAAMELATLARLHPGRSTAAFGHGVDAWMRQIDARPADRLGLLEETVAAVRALLAGESLTLAGRHVRLDGVVLDLPLPTPPPVLIGTTGPRGLAIAGRVADGIVLPEGTGPAAVRWAREQAGGTTIVYAWLRVSDDAQAAVSALRPAVAAWVASGTYPGLAEFAGLAADGTVDDAVVRSIAVVGDPAQCARAVEALWDAGADSVVLVPPPDDGAEQIARFAAAVRPLLAR